MSSATIIVRVISDAGRNRIEIDAKSTCEELQEIIGAKIGIPAAKVQFYQDMGYKKPFKYSATSSLMKAGITNGVQIFVPAKNAKMVDIIHKPIKANDEEEKIITSKPGKKSLIYPIDQIMKDDEETSDPNSLTKDCKHGPKAKCVHCLGVDKTNFTNVEYKCQHPKNQM